MTKSEYAYPDRLRQPVVMVGAGGIGSNVLPLIVKLGVRRLAIYDDDVLEPVNLEMQNFYARDVGRFKCEVLAERAREYNPAIEVVAIPRRLTAQDRLDGIVIAGVDSMQSRRVIFEALREHRRSVTLFVDGRLDRKLYKFFDLYCIDPKSRQAMVLYEEWLFTDEEVERHPRPVDIAGHVPYVLTGLIGELLARWVQTGRHPGKVTFDASTLHAEAYSVPEVEEESTL